MIEYVFKSCQFYGYALIQILIEPRQFFAELPGKTTLGKSFGFCALCSIFFVSASLMIGEHSSPVRMGFIFFFNSVGMVFISSAISYMIMVMILGKKVGYKLLFSVHAFSAGLTLLVSWMSFFFWFTEPWKWWLVYTGYKNTCRFSGKSALLILAMTLVVQFFFVYSLYLAFYK